MQAKVRKLPRLSKWRRATRQLSRPTARAQAVIVKLLRRPMIPKLYAAGTRLGAARTPVSAQTRGLFSYYGGQSRHNTWGAKLWRASPGTKPRLLSTDMTSTYRSRLSSHFAGLDDFREMFGRLSRIQSPPAIALDRATKPL